MKTLASLGLLAAMSLSLSAGAYAAVDAEAAQALMKKSDCFKCHAVDKDKKGPSYKKVAAKYKGKADAEEKVTKDITSGMKVKLEDGTEEEHKVIKSKDPAEIKNVVLWILSLVTQAALTIAAVALPRAQGMAATLVATQLGNALFSVIPAVAIAVCYHDLRLAREGVDTAELAKVFE